MDKQIRYEIVSEMASDYSISLLCSLAEVSRSGFYKWKKEQGNRKADNDFPIKEHILSIHKQYPYFGYQRMKTALRRKGLIMNHKKIRRLMKELGVSSVIRRKRKYYGKKGSTIFKNVLARNFESLKPLHKLVTDITYVRIGNEFVYLSAVMDLFNNEIVAWKLSRRNDYILVKETVEQLRCKGAVLHSDQGYQYTSRLILHC